MDVFLLLHLKKMGVSKMLMKLKKLQFFKLLVFSTMLVCQSSYALQTKTAIDNEPISAVISAHELTRIYVESDKIASVVGLSDYYLLQNDEQQGAIFIKPTTVFLSKSGGENTTFDIAGVGNKKNSNTKTVEKQNLLSIFITTQEGHNYILRLTPKNISAETIMLKPKTLEHKFSDNLASAYQQKLVRLVLAMVNRTFSDEYSVTYFDLNKTLRLKLGKANMFLVAAYQTDSLTGEIYQVDNPTNDEIPLSERQFYRNKVQTVFLQNRILLPKSSGFVYVVTKQIRV